MAASSAEATTGTTQAGPAAVKKDQSQVAANDLSNVTSNQGVEKELDTATTAKVLGNLLQDKTNDNAEQSKTQQDLAAIKVEAKDVELVMSEFEISKEAATLALKQNNADVLATLRSLLVQ